jgi:MFS family permease
MGSSKASDESKVEAAVDNIEAKELSADERTLQAVTPVTPPPPVQDGGTRAWLQVLGSFIVFINLWGFTFAYGSFQTYYELEYLPSKSASELAWIGTMATFLLIVGGVFSGPLFDLGFFRAMLLAGAFLGTLALFLLSLCTEYYQVLLTQGVLVGLANALLYLPGLALVGRSFKRHRSIAMSMTTCGAPVGGIIYTLMFEQLIGKLGFPWTIRAMAFFMLGSYLLAFPLLLYRAHNIGDLASGHARKLFDPTAFQDLLFWSYSISNFFVFLGYMVPFVYIAAYGQTHLHLSQSMALNMIIIAQATSVVGRLASGYSAFKVGVMIPWTICAISSGVFCIGWIGVSSEAGFIAIAALYGCFSGALIPLPPSVFPIVCPDPKVLGTRLGMAQAIGSLASLIGSPIAGALASINGGPDGTNWFNLQLFSGIFMVFGGCNLMVLWLLLIKRRDVGVLI